MTRLGRITALAFLSLFDFVYRLSSVKLRFFGVMLNNFKKPFPSDTINYPTRPVYFMR